MILNLGFHGEDKFSENGKKKMTCLSKTGQDIKLNNGEPGRLIGSGSVRPFSFWVRFGAIELGQMIVGLLLVLLVR